MAVLPLSFHARATHFSIKADQNRKESIVSIGSGALHTRRVHGESFVGKG